MTVLVISGVLSLILSGVVFREKPKEILAGSHTVARSTQHLTLSGSVSSQERSPKSITVSRMMALVSYGVLSPTLSGVKFPERLKMVNAGSLMVAKNTPPRISRSSRATS